MSRMHKMHNRLISYLGLVTIALFGIISILGTGGGGGGGNGVKPVIYTGLTTHALITVTNAKPLGEAAFLGAVGGSSVSVASVQSAPQDETRNTSVVSIVRALHTAVKEIGVTTVLDSFPVGWIETISVSGNCGGTLSGSLEVNEATETFTSSFVFDNYCLTPTGNAADGITMHGNAGLDGVCDPATFNITTQSCDFIDYTMTFTNLNSRGYGESQTMNGTLSSAITLTGYETTLNMDLRDDNPDVTFRFDNYLIQVSEDSPMPGIDSIVVSGDAYHPDYGYAVVSTITPAQLPSGSLGPPESGELLLTGADGTVGPTTATFTFTGFNTFTIAIDTDGDGTTDETRSCTWYPDSCFVV